MGACSKTGSCKVDAFAAGLYATIQGEGRGWGVCAISFSTQLQVVLKSALSSAVGTTSHIATTSFANRQHLPCTERHARHATNAAASYFAQTDTDSVCCQAS